MANDTNVQIELQSVILSFPAVWKAKKRKGASEDEDPKFSAAFLIDKDTKIGKANKKIIDNAIQEVIDNKWPKNPPKIKAEKKCCRDGDDESYEGYEDRWFVSSSSYDKPTIANRRGKIVSKDDGMLYAGCVVNAILTIWPQDNDHGIRINAQLDGIQFVEDGEEFSGGHKPLEEGRFKNLEDDDDDSDDEDEDEDDRKKSKSKKSDKKKKKSRDDDDDDDDSDDEDEDEDDPHFIKRSPGPIASRGLIDIDQLVLFVVVFIVIAVT